MKETLESIEELIVSSEELYDLSIDPVDKEVHKATLDVVVASWFLYASKNWF